MLKYFNTSSKNQSVDVRSSAPSASSYRPVLCMGHSLELRGWVPGTEQPWDTALPYSHALSKSPWYPAHQLQYFISSRENIDKTLEFIFSIFFPFLLPYLQDFQQKASHNALLTRNAAFPGGSSNQAASTAGPERRAIPHRALYGPRRWTLL